MNPQQVVSLTDLNAPALTAAFSAPVLVFLGSLVLTFALIVLIMIREKHSFDT
ncbi:MAG: hypothetical protein KDJ38_12615 [Gammaproteobacteria bacterium]|nr:hypothetical protein [Gammaproteobacteria bacterium]